MKKLFVAMLMAITMAASANAVIWKCEAYSPSAMGWAQGYYIVNVKQRALQEI